MQRKHNRKWKKMVTLKVTIFLHFTALNRDAGAKRFAYWQRLFEIKRVYWHRVICFALYRCAYLPSPRNIVEGRRALRALLRAVPGVALARAPGGAPRLGRQRCCRAAAFAGNPGGASRLGRHRTPNRAQRAALAMPGSRGPLILKKQFQRYCWSRREFKIGKGYSRR